MAFLDPPHPIPSPRAQELIRTAITELLRDPDGLFAAVDASVMATQPRPTQHDPELAEAIRASSRSNLTHWATHNLTMPGLPVPVNPAPEPLALAKLIALRGLGDTSQAAYVAGQNATWPFWMRAVFSLTSDAEELKEVLDVSARSIFAFVDAMVAALHEAIERERGEALSSANTRRLALVRELLDRAPTSIGRAGQELGYPIEVFRHTGVVVWSDRPVGAGGGLPLAEVVDALANSVAARLRRRPLTVMANPHLVWVWFPTDSLEPDLSAALQDAATPPRDVRIAIGPSEPAYHGFQSTHADARLTRRLMIARGAGVSVARYHDLALPALASGEPERAQRYIEHHLGPLVLAGPEVKETLHQYLLHRCSPSRTAAAIFTHRNTVLDRIRRAEEHLPRGIEGNELALTVALELDRLRWPTLTRGD